METQELYKQVLKVYGAEKQIWKLVEEIAECLQAVALHKMGVGTKEHAQEELADLEICTEQMLMIFGVERERKHAIFPFSVPVLLMQEQIVKYYFFEGSLRQVKDSVNRALDAVEQEKLKYGVDAVNAFKRQKLERLQKRIEGSV
jgi:hypothetical protein